MVKNVDFTNNCIGFVFFLIISLKMLIKRNVGYLQLPVKSYITTELLRTYLLRYSVLALVR